MVDFLRTSGYYGTVMASSDLVTDYQFELPDDHYHTGSRDYTNRIYTVLDDECKKEQELLGHRAKALE